MTALKVIGIILLILLLILLLRVGVEIRFGDALAVKLRIGPVRKTILPAGEKKPKKAKKETPQGDPGTETAPTKKRALPKLSLAEIKDLAATVLRALGAVMRSTCKRLRIDPLEVYVTFGGADPAEIAQQYGYASAAMWALMPHAEQLFTIPHPSLHLRMDYAAPATKAEGTVGLSFRIGDLFAIGLALLVPLVKWFLRFKRAHAHDVPPAPAQSGDAPQPQAETSEEQSEKLTA